MADPRVSTQPTRLQAGIISRIRLENFMCHSNLEIELGDSVNFITGQNGSGKSAILTALCVAFGSRARGTQRANTLKDFIKTGCSHALVQVDVKNQGEDAFKPDIYGDVIIVERRISESSSSITLKNSQGKRVGTKKDDLREVVVHFNIDVENPCVVMSQDKSREFLHSGNAKDKFKFFFKATLLQRLDDLLKGIEKQLNDATAMLNHLEGSLRPILKELDELQKHIRSMEQVEEISLQVQLLRKKLAWAWVYDAEKKLDQKLKDIENLKGRIPSCQKKIDLHHDKMKDLSDRFANKKNHVSDLLNRANEVKTKMHELRESVSMAAKERLELEGEQDRKTRQLQKMVRDVQLLEQQIHDMHEQYNRNTQAEQNEMEGRLLALQVEVDDANVSGQRLKEEEETMTQRIAMIEKELEEIARKVGYAEKSHHDISSRVRELQMHQTNKVTAFGGVLVTNLLRAIERHQHRFRIPPIGPIGAHVKLEHGDVWSIAVENAVGKLLNAFIVTNHKDSLLLRACAREANYNHLKIIIYDFSRPRMDIPWHMLPQTKHPTTLSVIHSDNPTVLNVLIDLGNAERQVLVKDYDVGKTVAFDQMISNLKEVYTSDGYKIFFCRFSRGSAQTILPPMRNLRAGRLCASFDIQIKDLERDAAEAKEYFEQGRGVKRSKEDELKNLQDSLRSIKKRKMNVDRHLRSKEFELQDLKNSLSSEAASASESTVDELHQEISKLQDEIREKETFLEKLQTRVDEAGNRAKDLKVSLGKFRESTNTDVQAFNEAEEELLTLENDLHEAEAKKKYYEGMMETKVLPDIEKAEAEHKELENLCKESHKKASIICPQSEIEGLGCKESNPEQLSAELTQLKERFQRESQRFSESIEDLKMLREKKQLKISRKQQTYKALREKLEVCEKALQLRWGKYQKTALGLAKQLTWHFSGHLRKKGIQGNIKVHYEEQTLSIEVTMPQDASSSTVKDTRGLSGGERSFSTLCFALTLHEMTEAPFRAMDEFDVFMDAVSRKISLDAIVDFALAQGSQWIFITPHDISMVKNDERIKKQQMAAPRG
ncbi:hypothetical protein ACJIZ3_022475 [Penstemon smallii]|uniref:RecF/RecN/SMC N-terminal domain-containing protein n=1 Tax=Penstemon smallii TaxID=265156 RepID=A0ABD3TLD5_9LAMI